MRKDWEENFFFGIVRLLIDVAVLLGGTGYGSHLMKLWNYVKCGEFRYDQIVFLKNFFFN